MKKLFCWFRLTIQLLAYTYSGLLIVYFSLRMIWVDRLSNIVFLSTLIPWILLPLFLLPILGFLVIKQKWFSIGSSIACLLLLGWLHSHYWTPENYPMSANATSLKVLSLNASWHSTTPETLVNLVETQNPDLFFIQESTRPHIRESFPQLKANYPYQVDVRPGGILSKYPIAFSETIHLAGHKETQQRAIVQLPQQNIVVYNVQTISPWIRPEKILPFLTIPTYQYSDRTAEINDLVQRIKQETLPVIAAGDFNLTDQAQDHQRLETVMQDAFKTSGFGFGCTWPNGFPLNHILKKTDWKLNHPLFRIDYIWYSAHFGSRNSQVLPSTGSEHLPVMTELLFVDAGS